jgi:hypothetical protein
MTPETIPDLNAFAVAAKTALDASAPTAREPEIAAICDHEIALARARETVDRVAAAPAGETARATAAPALAPVLDLPSAAELDRWLASPSRRAA